VIEFPRLRGISPPPHLMASPPIGPSGVVVQVSTTTPFHGHVQYHALPNHQGGQSGEYFEMCRSHGHSPRHCPILQKYSLVLNTIYYKFCGSPTQTTKWCHSLNALADRFDQFSFRVDEAPQGFGGGCGGRGGFTGG